MFETTRSGFGGLSFSARLTVMFETLAGRIAGWNDRRVTRNALLELSDHELDDIGLSRADVYDL
jgi:uncharacterized protein YjiS (DUF1127 family)